MPHIQHHNNNNNGTAAVYQSHHHQLPPSPKSASTVLNTPSSPNSPTLMTQQQLFAATTDLSLPIAVDKLMSPQQFMYRSRVSTSSPTTATATAGVVLPNQFVELFIV